MYDVIVVGAGAAGLLAAARAAERGLQVLLLEKNRKAGVKILMSGGTRCNLTHATDARGIVDAFGPPGRFLHSALAALGPQDLVELFRAEQVATKVEATGKIFPQSDSAVDVQQALLRRLGRSGAELRTGCAVRDIRPGPDHVEVAVDGQTLDTRQVLITTGGQSYPGCGTTGDGYAWAKQLGHRIESPRPALVPLTSNVPWCRALQGVTCDCVRVEVVRRNDTPSKGKRGERAKTAVGSILFTHFGVSGPAVMDVSHHVASHPHDSCDLLFDFLPDRSVDELSEWLQQAARRDGKRQVQTVTRDLVTKSLAQELLALSGIAPEQRLAELGSARRRDLVAHLKQLRLSIQSTLGFKKAEVTAGGVSLKEVDSRTMQSRKHPRVFLAGEILDLDGPIGGYNFQAAFSTGWLAAESLEAHSPS